MREKIQKAIEENGFQPESPVDTAHSLRANLVLEKRDRDTGLLTETREVKNIITNDGANFVRDLVGGAAGTAISGKAMRWTAVGNSRAAFNSASSGLNSEAARSQNAFNTTAAWGQFSNVTTFTNIAATIKESGLFNHPSVNSGTMLAAQTFGDITLTTNDSLEVVWKVYFSEV